MENNRNTDCEMARLTEEEIRVDGKSSFIRRRRVSDKSSLLAFYNDLEKWVAGSYIKIGYFGESDVDLKYRDEMHSLLVEQVTRRLI